VTEIRRIRDYDSARPGLEVLHKAHWEESETSYRGAPFGPQYDLFKRYFEWDMLQIWGAYSGERMVGHVSIYTLTSAHTGEKIAQEDALYVLPGHRKGSGAALLRRALSDLRAEGVKELWATTRPETRVGLLLRRLGFKYVSDTYLVRL
jgi:GNAT superfamily N-acetyltransferase